MVVARVHRRFADGLGNVVGEVGRGEDLAVAPFQAAVFIGRDHHGAIAPVARDHDRLHQGGVLVAADFLPELGGRDPDHGGALIRHIQIIAETRNFCHNYRWLSAFQLSARFEDTLRGFANFVAGRLYAPLNKGAGSIEFACKSVPCCPEFRVFQHPLQAWVLGDGRHDRLFLAGHSKPLARASRNRFSTRVL